VLDRFDLSGIYFSSFAVVVASILVGYALGKNRRRKGIQFGELPIGSVVEAMLGLLAFSSPSRSESSPRASMRASSSSSTT
jgi:apolipoprotein N-acyltransferase